MHVRAPQTLELSGAVESGGLHGTFHHWSSAAGDRDDETAGVHSGSIVSVERGTYAVDENGNVRELRGVLAQRAVTERFIAGGGFEKQPQYDAFLGPVQLPGGRNAYAIAVTPPGGTPETIDVDAASSMIDRISYTEEDGTATQDFFDYRVYSGALVALNEVDSNGDAAYDTARAVTSVRVNRKIDPSVFAVPANSEIRTAQPVTVPLKEVDGHYYVQVSLEGKPLWFLLDTGAQAVFVNTAAAAQAGLKPEGRVEITGAQRTGGVGLARVDSLQIGSATLPLREVTVLDLHNVTGSFQADGVLGYPLFASAEVEFDPAADSMTIAKPGTLRPQGAALQIDADRRLVEVDGKVNGADGRFVIDTGDSNELLLFHPFLSKHDGLVPPGNRHFARNYGAGGGVVALTAIVDELDLGPYRFFNRYTDLMLADRGAFADRVDAGNVGIGVLRNLILTFDIADDRLYAAKSPLFDDGRLRERTESF